MPNIETFRVVDAETRGCLNHIRVAPSERDDDSMEKRVEKRRQEAEYQRTLWSQNYYQNTKHLIVVPCDWLGDPV